MGVIMKSYTILTTMLLILTLSIVAPPTTRLAQPGYSSSTSDDLSGTSWQLVKFQDSDGTMVVGAGDRSKYTIAFGANGRATVRVDCNRGSGGWKYKGPNQIQFGSMSVTRAKCGPGSLHDRIVRDGAVVRNYVIKDGHLFLSLLEDAGTYELEPLARSSSPIRKR
jgi:para-nitrobenzyl esterase